MKITGCTDCPFFSSLGHCAASEFRALDPGVTPDWCPLPITVEVMTQVERIERLGKALSLTPGADGFSLSMQYVDGSSRRRWWIVGGVEGDQALPLTGNAHTVNEALDNAEAWLAPELERIERS